MEDLFLAPFQKAAIREAMVQIQSDVNSCIRFIEYDPKMDMGEDFIQITPSSDGLVSCLIISFMFSVVRSDLLCWSRQSLVYPSQSKFKRDGVLVRSRNLCSIFQILGRIIEDALTLALIPNRVVFKSISPLPRIATCFVALKCIRGQWTIKLRKCQSWTCFGSPTFFPKW